MATIADVATAQRCQGTPTLAVVDNRGLMVRTVQYNRTEMEGPLEELITQQTYSVLGHPSSSIDPRLLAEQQLDASVQPNFRYQHSLSGRPLKTHSQDAGALLVVYDCEGGPVWQRNSRDQQQRRTYDSLHRPTTYYEQAANDPEQVSERWFYGEELPVPAANCRGQLLRHYSPAGLSVTPSYSVIGQLLTSEQQFLRDEVLNSDWSGDDPARWNDDLTVQIYTSHWGFNALGIQVHSADAKGNQQRQRLNIAGQLAGSELQLFGHTTAHAVLRTIDYSAAGQVLHEEAGNGVVTDYGYEPQTQRLAALTTSRPELTGRPRLLQALTYQYDPVGNLLSISDGAEPTRYSHNQRVEAASQYSYDALYQLCQASGRENANATQQAQALPPAIVPLWQETGELTHYSRTYTYDRGSNLTTIRHVGLHPYTQQMVVAPTSNRAVQQTLGVTPSDVDSFFDACGNLRELNAGQPLVWNSRNQLQRSTQVVRSDPDDDTEQYWYDGQGQRSCKLATTRTSGTTHTARVYYLPGLELRQTRVQPHVGEPSVSEALQVINAGAAGRQSLRVLHWEQGKPAAIENDQCRYSLDDQIGSSLIELDQRADILTWEEYFPFGGTAVWSARNETETRYKYVRYSGKERDGTGLYYYGFRYYAPWLGRWLNPDPAGTVDGLNLFCMVGNNPITRKDPAGLKGTPYTRLDSEEGQSRQGTGRCTMSNIVSGIASGARRIASRVFKQDDYQRIPTYNSVYGPTIEEIESASTPPRSGQFFKKLFSTLHGWKQSSTSLLPKRIDRSEVVDDEVPAASSHIYIGPSINEDRKTTENFSVQARMALASPDASAPISAESIELREFSPIEFEISENYEWDDRGHNDGTWLQDIQKLNIEGLVGSLEEELLDWSPLPTASSQGEIQERRGNSDSIGASSHIKQATPTTINFNPAQKVKSMLGSFSRLSYSLKQPSFFSSYDYLLLLFIAKRLVRH
ncbi:RHS repeat-associated core domain-containing protein [Pseudomonas chlororaphis]|uniref:RHS repeat-associated core domain-containing protein n=1 Tax=Pseudomonas chlororaphis TaxID=587753 RepID=UPI0015DEA560|nr:RHS repeat protein [Pseudomonas chlororaphis]QLL16012.1 RHS repeat protein [Pseudomonas chlororaphis subsp. aurantiaca]